MVLVPENPTTMACLPRTALWRRWAAALVLVLGIAPAAAETRPTENALKAAFIYNFLKFIEWPAEAFPHSDSELTICIWGADTLDGALAPLAGKPVRHRQIRIRHLSDKTSVTGCHIVYVSRDEAGRLQQALARVGRKHVLTIGDMPGFAARGGAINLFKAEDRIRFEINLDAARTSGLTISSRLLSLARVVRGAN